MARLASAMLLALLLASSIPLPSAATDGPAPLVEKELAWTRSTGSNVVPIGTLTGPAGATTLFVGADLRLTTGAVTIRIIEPTTLVSTTFTLDAAREGRHPTGWRVLPATAGTWRFEASSSATHSGLLHVAAYAPAPLARETPAGADRFVLAIVDSGVDVYHAAFARPGLETSDLPAGISDADGDAPLSFPLHRVTNLSTSAGLDAAWWGSLPAGELVHFENTPILGIRLGERATTGPPVWDAGSHGTAVTHAAIREAPDALIVMINALDYDDAVRWAAQRPWIDAISMSWGPPANAAGVAEPYALGWVTPEATRLANDAGKLVFGASGNDPTPTITDTTSGPIWVHAVAGSHASTHSRAASSGNFVDTVANWTQTLAVSRSWDRVASTSGTSFATPLTAGVAARIVGEVRAAAGHSGGIRDGALVRTPDLVVTNRDVRDALNASAVWWSTTQWSLGSEPPQAPVVPWTTMGWGHVDGSLVPLAVADLLGAAPAAKPSEARAWMDAHAAARDAYWLARGVTT